MSERNDGGPAFPCEVDSTQPLHRQVGNTVWQTYGMTLRDYFAAKLVQGFAAQGAFVNGSTPTDEIVADAYDIADEMLKARAA